MKNISFRVDPSLIQKARVQARRAGMTLEEGFQQWLGWFAEQGDEGTNYRTLMKRLEYARPGRRFARKELSEH